MPKPKHYYIVKNLFKWADLGMDIENSVGFLPVFSLKAHALAAAKGDESAVVTIKAGKKKAPAKGKGKS